MADPDDLIPPDELIYIGGGNFQAIGREFFRYLVDLGGLQPDHRVLDVGCGIGRLAVPLTRYLDKRGSYDGFDIVPLGIAWCREQITARYPHFRFQVADLFNRSYHPAGRYEASTYTFPYPAATFDFVLLTSVLTHLLPADLENYLYEISRVLKPDGRCLLTYFLLNPESAALLEAGKSQLDFKPRRGVYRTISPHRPEDAVCYDEAYIRRLHAHYGLAIRPPIHYGSWCARANALSHQDIVVATRLAGVSAPKPRVAVVRRLGLTLRRCFFRQVVGTLGRVRHRSAASAVHRHIQARRPRS
jgi:SAM-dependent methyltransferase